MVTSVAPLPLSSVYFRVLALSKLTLYLCAHIETRLQPDTDCVRSPDETPLSIACHVCCMRMLY